MQVKNEHQDSLLVEAVSKRVMQDIIQIIDAIEPSKIESVIIRRRGQRNQNLLHVAAKDGQLIIFKLLLSKIEDKTNIMKIRDIQNYHVLHLALLQNHVELARYILETISDPKERHDMLNLKKKCADCIKSPEALALIYEMQDDSALRYTAPKVLGQYYYSGQPNDYSAPALKIFKRSFLALPKSERGNYALYSTVGETGLESILEKAMSVTEKDDLQLLRFIVQELDDSDKEKICLAGMRYVRSVDAFEYLLNHIINKESLLSNLLTECISSGKTIFQFDVDLFMHYLSAIAKVDNDAAEIINKDSLNSENALEIIEQLRVLHEKRVQTIASTNVAPYRKTRGGALLLDFLDAQSLLSLRLVNKANCEFVAQIQGPYSSPHEFVAANSGIYSSSEELKDAMIGYFTTINSTSFHPAVLYKLKEHGFGLSSSHEFSERRGENLVKTGRKYTPANHTWTINAAWVLAQLHKGRDFVFLSELVDPYVKRQNGKYSALSKEVACAIVKAGYQTSVEALSASTSTFFLRKPLKNNHQLFQLKIRDFLELKDEECEHAVGLVQSYLKEDFEKTKARVDKIIKQFQRLHRCEIRETFELIDYKEIRRDLEYLTQYLSLYSHEGKSIPQSFINYYNERRVAENLQDVIPELSLDFNQPSAHQTAPQFISNMLSSAFLDLYCAKEDELETTVIPLDSPQL